MRVEAKASSGALFLKPWGSQLQLYFKELRYKYSNKILLTEIKCDILLTN